MARFAPRLTLALALLAAPAAAQMSDAEKLKIACTGWATDRLMVSIVAQKNREAIKALDDIGDSNPSKPLARAVSDSLTTINAGIAKGRDGTTPVLEAVCPTR